MLGKLVDEKMTIPAPISSIARGFPVTSDQDTVKPPFRNSSSAPAAS